MCPLSYQWLEITIRFRPGIPDRDLGVLGTTDPEAQTDIILTLCLPLVSEGTLCVSSRISPVNLSGGSTGDLAAAVR